MSCPQITVLYQTGINQSFWIIRNCAHKPWKFSLAVSLQLLPHYYCPQWMITVFSFHDLAPSQLQTIACCSRRFHDQFFFFFVQFVCSQNHLSMVCSIKILKNLNIYWKSTKESFVKGWCDIIFSVYGKNKFFLKICLTLHIKNCWISLSFK